MPCGPHRKVTREEEKKIIKLVKRGYSYGHVGRELGYDHTTIARYALSHKIHSRFELSPNKKPIYAPVSKTKKPPDKKTVKIVKAAKAAKKPKIPKPLPPPTYKDLLEKQSKMKFIRGADGILLKVELVKKTNSLSDIIKESQARSMEAAQLNTGRRAQESQNPIEIA